MPRWTVADLLEQAATELKPVGATARLDAEVLLAGLLCCDRSDLLTHPEKTVAKKSVDRYAELLERRLDGWPIAYLTGWQDFCGLPLAVTPDVLIPRPSSELLIMALQQRRPAGATGIIVDVGTGSGALALAAANLYARTPIVATDVSLAALRLAAANARWLRLSGRIDFRRGSLLEPVESDWLEVILANLPYLNDRQLAEPSIAHEPPLALRGGYSGLSLLRGLFNQARTRGDWDLMIVEFDPAQTSTVGRLAAANWPEANLEPLRDGRLVRGLVIERR